MDSSFHKMIAFYSQFIKPNDLCFDIGANLGNRTEIFLALGASVLAVEPQPLCAQELRKKYEKNDRFTLVEKAVGPSEGEAEMLIASYHTISSMSKEWIHRVKKSGRFTDYQWDEKFVAPMTTLDQLIRDSGIPSFCKIDVEGFEYEVLLGLSRPIQSISFEFTQEYIEAAINSINYLSSIGKYQFNYSLGESMQLTLQNWAERNEICEVLSNLQGDLLWGDLYAKVIPE